MAQVYITHGYTANGDKHWFPWLETELAKLGVSSKRLTMPNSSNPTPEEWLAYHQAEIKLNEETILIGHSLGCIATLNYLATKSQKIKGAIFVAGFYERLPNLPELNTFVDFFRNLTACKPEKSFVLAALNDPVVNHQFSENLAKLLNAEYLSLPIGGHFLDREGITELPPVLEWVKRLLNS